MIKPPTIEKQKDYRIHTIEADYQAYARDFLTRTFFFFIHNCIRFLARFIRIFG